MTDEQDEWSLHKSLSRWSPCVLIRLLTTMELAVARKLSRDLLAISTQSASMLFQNSRLSFASDSSLR